ncbi:MAG: hypothetical protein K8F91_17685, partial [Candidatus Obscuribacterales bacterium]|nr:hypothetical protein [Candidatus Obscuribacterales bacterium]
RPVRGIAASPDAAQTRNVREAANVNPLFDLDAGKTGVVKAETDSSRQKSRESDKTRVISDVREGRLILSEMVKANTFRVGISRSVERGLDGARMLSSHVALWAVTTHDYEKAKTIREILGKFKLTTPRRDFKPEITESGSYRVVRNNSSQKLQAFGSSARHMAISMPSDASMPVIESTGSTDSKVEQDAVGQARKLLRKDDGLKGENDDEDARQWHVVKAGETPESIALVRLNDIELADLIREINKLLLQEMYDRFEQEHVDVLPAGVMILLPNEKDIAAFQNRTG